MFTKLNSEEMMMVNGGGNKDYYNIGYELGQACKVAAQKVEKAVTSAINTVKGWFN